MATHARFAFLLLVLAQACHSAEEYRAALWAQLLPARLISEALSSDPARGFLAANAALVLFGLFCWAVPLRLGLRAARPLAWGWAAIETTNGIGHLLFAIVAGGYFPGLVTAPLLLAGATNLALALRRSAALDPLGSLRAD
jgi:hypothetical protein